MKFVVATPGARGSLTKMTWSSFFCFANRSVMLRSIIAAPHYAASPCYATGQATLRRSTLRRSTLRRSTLRRFPLLCNGTSPAPPLPLAMQRDKPRSASINCIVTGAGCSDAGCSDPGCSDPGYSDTPPTKPYQTYHKQRAPTPLVNRDAQC